MERAKFADGAVWQMEPSWVGKLPAFTFLFEALVLVLCHQKTLAAARRLMGEGRHRGATTYEQYVEVTLAQADLFAARELPIDEPSRAGMTTLRWPLMPCMPGGGGGRGPQRGLPPGAD